MGQYFPGVALPAAIDENKIDFRFQPPGKPNGLLAKWQDISHYLIGMVLGPSGSGKV
jgi:hypothetical protein